MKKIVLSLLFLCVSLSFAQMNPSVNAKNALGLWFQGHIHAPGGEDVGIDWKHRMGGNVANDLYVSFGFYDGFSIGVYDAYLWHYNNVIPVDKATMGTIPLYWGPRAGLGLWGNSDYTDFALHVGLVGGIAWDFSVPVGVFFEINPTLEIRSDGPGDEWRLWGPSFYLRLGVRGWLFRCVASPFPCG
jgi:hypothetical protein